MTKPKDTENFVFLNHGSWSAETQRFFSRFFCVLPRFMVFRIFTLQDTDLKHFFKPMVFFRFPRRSPRAREMCFFHGLISPFCLWQPNIRTRFPNQKDTEKMFMCFFNHGPRSTLHGPRFMSESQNVFPKDLAIFLNKSLYKCQQYL